MGKTSPFETGCFSPTCGQEEESIQHGHPGEVVGQTEGLLEGEEGWQEVIQVYLSRRDLLCPLDCFDQILTCHNEVILLADHFLGL